MGYEEKTQQDSKICGVVQILPELVDFVQGFAYSFVLNHLNTFAVTGVY